MVRGFPPVLKREFSTSFSARTLGAATSVPAPDWDSPSAMRLSKCTPGRFRRKTELRAARDLHLLYRKPARPPPSRKRMPGDDYGRYKMESRGRGRRVQRAPVSSLVVSGRRIY